jgi:dTDP-4-dehydrorhamnose reductase
VVVYLAGSPDPMVAEENIRAMESVHAGGPAEVFSAGEILQPKFLYVSTAYVFDGARGNYREDDTVLPANSFGKAKLAGENFIRTRSLNHTIVRSAPILGQGNGRRLTFLDTLREKLERKEACFCDGTELFNFTLVEPVVDLLARLVSQSPKKGLLHLGGLAKMTVFEVAKLFAGSVGYDPNLIVEKRQMTAINAYKRPDFSLNCTQAIQKFHFETPPIKFSN